jgi:hypothetical protein
MTSKNSLYPRQRSDKRIRNTDLAPDGVRIVIDWERLVLGASIFIPAVNTPELVIQFKSAMPKDWKIEYRNRIENGKWGVRFWRML